jgi:hypothetical protein
MRERALPDGQPHWLGLHTPSYNIVILSGAAASRSEAVAESKDPCIAGALAGAPRRFHGVFPLDRSVHRENALRSAQEL